MSAVPQPSPSRSGRHPGHAPAGPQPQEGAVTPRIGRAMELATVHRLLVDDRVRLLTLTGTAGVGKTRLALETAAALEHDRSTFDAVHMVPLAAVTAPEHVLAEIAKATGVRDGGAVPLLESIRIAAQDRRILLILDTFEHLTPASADLATLLEGCPGVTLLVTSRTPLHLSGEREVTVAPLAVSQPAQPGELPDAVALFVTAARTVNPDFALTPESHAIIADVCQRLDGIPLAIELAASHTRDLSLDQLQGRLDRHLGTPSGRSRDLPPRQRSMHAAIAWSYDLLPPEDQALLRRLSVFPGGFTAATVEAMGDPDAERPPLTSLANLVDASLAHSFTDTAGELRFVFFDAVREYGREQQDRHQEEDAHQLMANALIAFVQEVEPTIYRGRDLAVQLARIDAELNNLRAAMTWADTHAPDLLATLSASLGQYWLRRSMLHEGRTWAERALSHGARLDDRQRLRAMIDRNRMMTYQGDPAVAAAHAEAAALARQLGDPDRELDTIASRMVAAMIRRDYEAVAPLVERAWQIERDHPARQRLSAGRRESIRILGALASMECGDLDTAMTLVRESQIYARVEGDESVAMIASRVLGGIQSTQGYPAEAIRHYQDALRAYYGVGERWISAVVVLEIAWEFVQRQPTLAARLFGVGDHLMASIGHAPMGGLRTPPNRWRHLKPDPGDPEAWDAAYTAGFAEPLEPAIDAILALSYPEAIAPPAPPLDPRNEASPASRPMPALSQREREVLACIAAGRTDREIATALGISYRTTTTYVANIFAKLNVRSRAGAAAIAVRFGLDQPDA